jgi:hypothetical protein
VIGGVHQQRDLLGRQRRHLCPGHRGWSGVGGDIAGEQLPGDRLGQGAVQAAVHGQDVLGGEPTRLAVPAAADGQPVVDGLDLQRRQLLEGPGADVGSYVVAEQRGVPGHGAGAQAAANVRQPAVQVLVDRGHSIAGPYQGTGAGVRFELRHRGQANFIVDVLDVDGQELGNLSNEIGSFQGSQIGEVPEGVFWLRVQADGSWTVTMREV